MRCYLMESFKIVNRKYDINPELFWGDRLPYAIRPLSVCPVLSVCPSVTLVYCGQTVGHIKMKLGMQLGLGLGHIVLDGDLAPPPPKGEQPPIFGPCLLWPYGCMDQDVTSYGARPRLMRLCVRWGPRSPSPKGSGAPQFSAHVYCGQTAGWIKLVFGMEVGLSPGRICVRW